VFSLWWLSRACLGKAISCILEPVLVKRSFVTIAIKLNKSINKGRFPHHEREQGREQKRQGREERARDQHHGDDVPVTLSDRSNEIDPQY
jgi:hypothetical protein